MWHVPGKRGDDKGSNPHTWDPKDQTAVRLAREPDPVDLRDKLNVLDGSGDDFRPSLRELGDTAKAGAEKASGDVKEHLTSYVTHVDFYEKTATGADVPYDFLDVRIWLDDTRDNLAEACKASGYPIELEPDRHVP